MARRRGQRCSPCFAESQANASAHRAVQQCPAPVAGARPNQEMSKVACGQQALAERIPALGPDASAQDLTEEELRTFHSDLKLGALGHALGAWEPWWTRAAVVEVDFNSLDDDPGAPATSSAAPPAHICCVKDRKAPGRALGWSLLGRVGWKTLSMDAMGRLEQASFRRSCTSCKFALCAFATRHFALCVGTCFGTMRRTDAASYDRPTQHLNGPLRTTRGGVRRTQCLYVLPPAGDDPTRSAC